MGNKVAIQKKEAFESQVEWMAQRAVKLTSLNAACVFSTWGSLVQARIAYREGRRGLSLQAACWLDFYSVHKICSAVIKYLSALPGC